MDSIMKNNSYRFPSKQEDEIDYLKFENRVLTGLCLVAIVVIGLLLTGKV